MKSLSYVDAFIPAEGEILLALLNVIPTLVLPGTSPIAANGTKHTARRK
ncbi:hypothetical protein [Microbacterium sp. AK031]|nr:hypothetical protein [Microbacterium sp. AK031]